MKRATTTSALPAIVDRALPRRALRIERTALVAAILERIEAYRAAARDVAPHRERVKQAAKVAESLRRALGKVAVRLERLGAEADIRGAIERSANLGITSPRPPLGDYSAVLDLYLVVAQATAGLNGWNRVHRPQAGAPTGIATALTYQIDDLCRRAGLSSTERDTLLDQISERNGLPKLTVATLKKRKTRRKKKTATR